MICRKKLITILKRDTNVTFEDCVDLFIDKIFGLPMFYNLSDPFQFSYVFKINEQIFIFPSESSFIIFYYFLRYMWYRIKDVPNEVISSDLSPVNNFFF